LREGESAYLNKSHNISQMMIMIDKQGLQKLVNQKIFQKTMEKQLLILLENKILSQ